MSLAPFSLDVLRYWNPGRGGTSLKRHLRALGRKRLKLKARRLLEAVGRSCPTFTTEWSTQATDHLAGACTESLVAIYDRSKVGRNDYQLRGLLAAVDEAAFLDNSDDFDLVYRRFLWCLYLASQPRWLGHRTELDEEFFRLLDVMHADVGK